MNEYLYKYKIKIISIYHAAYINERQIQIYNDWISEAGNVVANALVSPNLNKEDKERAFGAFVEGLHEIVEAKTILALKS